MDGLKNVNLFNRNRLKNGLLLNWIREQKQWVSATERPIVVFLNR
jgi:hypothetical protein